MLSAFVERAGSRKQRHFMGRAIHGLFVAPENFLRAIAMMNVEIDHSDAFCAMDVSGVTRRNGRIAEKAETHRSCGFGVMPRRACGDEGVGETSAHHLVGRESRAARRALRGLQSAGRHGGV